MNQDWFKKILSNPKSSFSIKLLLGFLHFASFFYGFGVFIRNVLYELKLKKAYKADKPVISVGNITAGGTGKTPLVIWLCDYLSKCGLKCAILTRGYKSGKGHIADEPAIFAKACKEATVIVNSDRVKSAAKAVSELSCDVMVMDDGFQHLRLKRDIDILMIDATCPFGFERLLPAGLLREPLSAIKRADAAVITRTDLVDQEKIFQIEQTLTGINCDIIIAKSVHKPFKAFFTKGQEMQIEQFADKRVYAFCGIGNPDAFFKTLKLYGIKTVAEKIYNDHHQFAQQDLSDIYEEARYLQSDVILSTQKDWVKTALFSDENCDILFGYLAVELSFTGGEEKIQQLIKGIL